MGHRRKNTLRLRNHDYSDPRAYFVTTVTHRRRPILARSCEERSELTEYGKIVARTWSRLPARFSGIPLDVFIIMPDHMHGIIWLESVGAIHELPLQMDKIRSEKKRSRRSMTLSKAVGFFKMNTAKCINRAIGRPGNPFWQRGSFEHIIRNPDDPDQIRSYIEENPLRWSLRGQH